MKLITSLRSSFCSSNTSNKKDKRSKKNTARSASRKDFASLSTSSPNTAGSETSPKSVLRRAATDVCTAERITGKELELVLRRLGPQPPTEEEVAAMLAEAAERLGRDKSFRMEEIFILCGGSSFQGEATLEPPPPSGELKEAFAVFDADGDGRISAEELHALLGQEWWCTLEDCKRMIDGVDTDGDGYVCFEEFVRMMT